MFVDLETYRPKLERFARGTFRLSREDAQDAAQETLIKARNVEFDGRDPYNFLARVLANVVSSSRRRHRVPTFSYDQLLPSGKGEIVDTLVSGGDQAEIDAELLFAGLLATLTERQARAFSIWEETGSYAEVARRLEITRQTAYKLVERARCDLRASLS